MPLFVVAVLLLCTLSFFLPRGLTHHSNLSRPLLRIVVEGDGWPVVGQLVLRGWLLFLPALQIPQFSIPVDPR